MLDAILGSDKTPSGSSVIIAGEAVYTNLESTTKHKMKHPEILGSLHAIANAMPAWQPFYQATSNTLFQSYQLWIDAIHPNEQITPAMQTQIDDATATLKDSMYTLSDILSQADAEFQKVKQYEPDIDWDTWIAQGQWGNKIDEAKSTNDAAASHLQTLMVQAYGAGYQELVEYQNAVEAANPLNPAPNKNYKMKVRDIYGSHWVPIYSVPGLDGYQEWVTSTIAAWHGGKTPDAFVYKYDKSTYSETYTKWAWGGSFNIPLEDWFWVGGGTSGEKDSTNVSQYTFNGQIAFQDVYYLPISPGPWFNGSLELTFKDSTIPNVAVWGPKGLLATQITGLLIGLGETIYINWSEKDWQKVYTYWKAHLSFGIGPFTLASASLSNKSDDYSCEQTGGSFKFRAINPQPRIIAYIVSTPNYSQ